MQVQDPSVLTSPPWEQGLVGGIGGGDGVGEGVLPKKPQLDPGVPLPLPRLRQQPVLFNEKACLVKWKRKRSKETDENAL